MSKPRRPGNNPNLLNARRNNSQLTFDWAAEVAATVHAQSLSAEASPRSASDVILDGPVRPDDDESSLPAGVRYAPGHPWHYYRLGDNAAPLPFDTIPASDEAGRALARELPKSHTKRLLKARELLAAERQGLEDDRGRYQQIVERGADALSSYDRDIACAGNDEMARAEALAMNVNHIAWRRGRIAWLERESSLYGSRRR